MPTLPVTLFMVKLLSIHLKMQLAMWTLSSIPLSPQLPVGNSRQDIRKSVSSAMRRQAPAGSHQQHTMHQQAGSHRSQQAACAQAASQRMRYGPSTSDAAAASSRLKKRSATASRRGQQPASSPSAAGRPPAAPGNRALRLPRPRIQPSSAGS
jgi:hypothetical protein